jgi:hypothetical protein
VRHKLAPLHTRQHFPVPVCACDAKSMLTYIVDIRAHACTQVHDSGCVIGCNDLLASSMCSLCYAEYAALGASMAVNADCPGMYDTRELGPT